MSPVNLSASEIRRRIGEMLECRMSGQTDRMLSHFSPHAVLHCSSSREALLPPGVWIGVEAIRSVTRRSDENYEALNYEILDIVVDGQSAAVQWRGAWRGYGNRKIYEIDAAHFLRWEDGQVVEMHEFFQRASKSAPGCNRLITAGNLFAKRPPGLDRDEIERRAHAFASFPSNDLETGAISKMCSPDVICDFVGDRARIPYSGRHVGIDALLNLVRAVAVDFEQCYCGVYENLIEDGRVAGRRKVEWRHRGTGRGNLFDLATFLRFEDGLITEIVEFRDCVTLLEMQGEVETPLFPRPLQVSSRT